MKFLKLLSKGNQKLDKSILGWSITPVKSCKNCKDCKDDCYALGPYNRYPNTKIAWDRNFEMAKDNSFVDHVIDQINRLKVKPSAVRIHVAGDFFSQDYIDDWQYLAKCYPDVKFYTYTKVMHLFDFEGLVTLPNVNIINSITPLGINFGSVEYCKKLVEIGYRICPATEKDSDILCGGTAKNSCTLCQNFDKVCFIKHK